MKVFYLLEVVEFLEKANKKDKARVTRTRQYFEKYGFFIGKKYIRKVRPNLWELKAGKIRVFLCIKGSDVVGVHAIYKKSQKLPLREIRIAVKRCKEL